MPTGNFNITTLSASQNQKEVTINDAFYLIDALLRAGALSAGDTTPPGSPAEGDVYILGGSPTGAWSGQGNKIAYYANGWKFITPAQGMRLWVNDISRRYFYNGSTWYEDGFFVETSGEYFRAQRKQVIKSALSGGTVTETNFIPDRALVFGLSLRVTTLITGATSFNAGYTGSLSAFGSSIGVALDTTNIGLLGNPQGFFANTNLVFTANGGNFSAGQITAVLHYLEFKGPWTW